MRLLCAPILLMYSPGHWPAPPRHQTPPQEPKWSWFCPWRLRADWEVVAALRLQGETGSVIKPQNEVQNLIFFLNKWTTLEHLGTSGVASGVHKPSSHDLPGPSQGTQQTLKTQRRWWLKIKMLVLCYKTQETTFIDNAKLYGCRMCFSGTKKVNNFSDFSLSDFDH